MKRLTDLPKIVLVSGCLDTAFEELDDDRFRLEVKDGLAIAKNEKAPDLVMLPVPGPEVEQ